MKKPLIIHKYLNNPWLIHKPKRVTRLRRFFFEAPLASSWPRYTLVLSTCACPAPSAWCGWQSWAACWRSTGRAGALLRKKWRVMVGTGTCWVLPWENEDFMGSRLFDGDLWIVRREHWDLRERKHATNGIEVMKPTVLTGQWCDKYYIIIESGEIIGTKFYTAISLDMLQIFFKVAPKHCR